MLIAIGLPVVLLTALLTHRESLLGQLAKPPSADAPNLFAINITEEALPTMKDWVAEREQVAADFAPLVRARLLAINGEYLVPIPGRIDDPELLRQERMRHREHRLSWRYELGPDETIMEGEWLDVDAPIDEPEASIETRFANAVGLKLGDTMSLSIQGLPLDVKVTSIRKVDWRNARPNFFVLITPSALEDAPQEWISAMSVPHDERRQIQADMNKEFVAVTVIDIGEFLQRIRVIFAAVLTIISWLAGLGLAVGLLVLGALLLNQHSATPRRCGAAACAWHQSPRNLGHAMRRTHRPTGRCQHSGNDLYDYCHEYCPALLFHHGRAHTVVGDWPVDVGDFGVGDADYGVLGGAAASAGDC